MTKTLKNKISSIVFLMWTKNRAVTVILIFISLGFLVACYEQPSYINQQESEKPTYWKTNTLSINANNNYKSFKTISTCISPPTEIQSINTICYSDPQKALDAFLDGLYNKEFEIAAELFGDPYSLSFSGITSEQMTREEKIRYLANYLKNHCESYGTCLNHRVVSMEKRNDDEYWFGVVFFDINGDFVSPVISEEQLPTKESTGTVFAFKMLLSDGCFKSWMTSPITP